MSKTLLITGATGKQGGAVVNALIASASTPPLTILALHAILSRQRQKRSLRNRLPLNSLLGIGSSCCDFLFRGDVHLGGFQR